MDGPSPPQCRRASAAISARRCGASCWPSTIRDRLRCGGSASQLRAVEFDISRRQVMRLLIAGQGGFLAEAQDVLRAGLTAAAWVSVDDTGARHKAANGVCTQIGNDHFAWFGTTASKSRLNFLDLLRAGHTDYVINAEALAYMHDHGLAGPVIARLAEAPEQHF